MSFFAELKYRMMKYSRNRKLSFFVENVCGGQWPVMLDVGVADDEHSPFDNFLEKQVPYPERLTVLSIYPLHKFKKRYPLIKAIVYSGDVFPFPDNEFEVVHSNAVVEHVGDIDRQIRFVRELSRVGKKFFLTTPSKLFPVELHTNLPFVHYLPKRCADRVMTMLGKGWAARDYMHLLTKKRLARILHDAGIEHYRIITKRFLGLPLHYYVIGNKARGNNVHDRLSGEEHA